MGQLGKHRKSAFLVLCVACIAAIAIYGFVTVRSHRAPSPAAPQPPAATGGPASGEQSPGTSQERATTAAPTAEAPGAAKPEGPPGSKSSPAARVPAKPELLYFRANALGPNYGKLAEASLSDLGQPQYAADLYCDRVHFSGGNGVCLYADRGMFTTYYAIGFNGHMQRRWSFKLDGLPSRVRVSPSGKFAALTIFLVGQSYASLDFATRTSIINAATGEVLAPDLEQFSVTRDGTTFKEKDFNFWGVTFAHDENRIYATLWSAGKTYLVVGDVAKHAFQVIHNDVECPSLSPDNTRIAFKKRLGEKRVAWHLTVLDLKTGQETPLAESRSVDDQVEWLDNDHILYALSESEKGASASTDIWVIPATAEGVPQILLKGGFSPAVVRSTVVAMNQ